MPRSTRLLDLVNVLASSNGKRAKDLARKYEVTERTIYRDLDELSASGIPIVHTEEGYRLMEGAVLRPVALTVEEAAVLRLVLDNPAIRGNSELRRRIDGLSQKIGATMTNEAGEPAVRLAGADRSGPIAANVMRGLETAVARRKSVTIDYVSLRSGRREKRGVDPWAVFHRGEAWYLIGRCHKSDEPRMFRIDRIASVGESGGTFTMPPDFDLNRVLRTAWSIYRGETLHEVVIHFDASLAPLIGNARHHEDERVSRLPGGDLEYRVSLSHLEEIARWIVTFGGKARAIAPEELIARVRELAEGAAGAHEPPSTATIPVRNITRRAAKTARR
jgi:predicted DNA-binding transcriptional regulator YafY